MKAKIISAPARALAASVRYHMNPEKGARTVCGTIQAASTREVIDEFQTFLDLRPEIKKPLLHIPLSLPPGERISDETWEKLTHRFMEKMGIDPTVYPFCGTLHDDRAHLHVHLLISRVGIDGSLCSDSNNVFRAIEACQELEVEFGLTRTKGYDPDADPATHRRSLSKNEMEMGLREDVMPPRQFLQQEIDAIL
ncbi:relaxase/mobilization nuclease domain-containing protein, partial [Aeromonas caviae]|uniref:relaxase/mobilization nuclease domain-containing protein n=1 Tax=Aeromonas caviae TaxID=648 RepID=UPI0038D2508B